MPRHLRLIGGCGHGQAHANLRPRTLPAAIANYSDGRASPVTRLCSAGPVALIGAHVYWPPEVRERLHLKGPVPIGKGHPEVDAALARELGERLATPACDVPIDLRIVGGLGRVADHLVQIAEEEGADLMVVGSHQRTPLARLWHGSISHGVIDAAPMSVLCVPTRGNG